MPLEDTGRAVTVIDFHRATQAGDAIVEREGRNALEQCFFHQRLVSEFVEDTGELVAVVVSFDPNRWRGWHRVAIDAGPLKRPAVGNRNQRQAVAPVSPDRANVDGMLR